VGYLGFRRGGLQRPLAALRGPDPEHRPRAEVLPRRGADGGHWLASTAAAALPFAAGFGYLRLLVVGRPPHFKGDLWATALCLSGSISRTRPCAPFRCIPGLSSTPRGPGAGRAPTCATRWPRMGPPAGLLKGRHGPNVSSGLVRARHALVGPGARRAHLPVAGGAGRGARPAQRRQPHHPRPAPAERPSARRRRGFSLAPGPLDGGGRFRGRARRLRAEAGSRRPGAGGPAPCGARSTSRGSPRAASGGSGCTSTSAGAARAFPRGTCARSPRARRSCGRPRRPSTPSCACWRWSTRSAGGRRWTAARTRFT
jgi:hypothetical protein